MTKAQAVIQIIIADRMSAEKSQLLDLKRTQKAFKLLGITGTDQTSVLECMGFDYLIPSA